jgi:hypothetical protein
LDVQDPSGNVAPVFAAELSANVPEPFKSEPSGGTGTRMQHKFTVIDFDKPTARVYLGSYNFSMPADRKNGENPVIVKDRRIAVSYMIEALSFFDHYSFRVAEKGARAKGQKLHLSRPPRPRRKAVVGRRLHGRAQDQGSRTLFLTAFAAAVALVVQRLRGLGRLGDVRLHHLCLGVTSVKWMMTS